VVIRRYQKGIAKGFSVAYTDLTAVFIDNKELVGCWYRNAGEHHYEWKKPFPSISLHTTVHDPHVSWEGCPQTAGPGKDHHKR